MRKRANRRTQKNTPRQIEAGLKTAIRDLIELLGHKRAYEVLADVTGDPNIDRTTIRFAIAGVL